MTYVASVDAIYLFGGTIGEDLNGLNMTLITGTNAFLKGTLNATGTNVTWTELTTPAQVDGIAAHTAAYSAAINKIIVFGGLVSFNGTVRASDDLYLFDMDGWQAGILVTFEP